MGKPFRATCKERIFLSNLSVMGNLYTCSQEAWLSEPTVIDNTWANYGEKMVAFG
jgi:hypothetical protein